MDILLNHTATLTNVNNRIEMHGEDRVPGVDVDIIINDIEAGELDQLSLDGEHYSTAFWNQEDSKDAPGGYKLTSPKFALLKTQTIDLKLEGYRVSISVESADLLSEDVAGLIEIEPAVIKKIKFVPKHHGAADLSLQVQGSLHGSEIGRLVDLHLGNRITFKCEQINQDLLDGSGSQDA